jgi:hypothetical protein
MTVQRGVLFRVASLYFVGTLVAGDGGVDGAGPGVDAAGDGLGLVEALLAEPCGYGEGAGAVVAENEDGGVFVELLVGAGGDVVHGEEGAAFDVGGGVLPRLADIEEEGRVFGGEGGLELVDGDFEIHSLKNTGVGAG